MPLRQTAILKWKDQNGGTRTQTVSTQDNPAPAPGTVAGLMTAMRAASDCGLWAFKMAPAELVDEAPEDGPYPTVKDVALLIFRTSAGTTIRLNVPGPKAAMFVAGSNRVDPDAPIAAAVIAAVMGSLSDAAGNPATTFIQGTRQMQQVPPPVGP